MKWVIGVVVVVIIVIVLWWSGIFGGSTPAPVQQSATVVNSIATSTVAPATGNQANSVIDSSVSGIDAQISAINTTMAGIKTPTKSQVSALAVSFQGVNVSLGQLAVVLTTRITNAKTGGTSVTGLQAALVDLNHQLSNMTSQVGAAAKNVMATSSTSVTYQQSFKQLQTAQTYLQAARSDVGIVLQGLNIK
jgi:hypothetical protein